MTRRRKRRSLAAVLGCVLCLTVPTNATADPDESGQDPIPVLAYYYIWFNATSWNRAKADYPLAGRYSSDETSVMREHVRLARAAGIDGFIVSWKSTPSLDERLARLVEVAEAQDFKIAVIYQGLDFERNPLPPARIASDLDRLASTVTASPAFEIFEKPLVIWSGTWKFTPDEISAVAGPRRDRLLILASSRSAEEYRELDGAVDGNAYYWAGADPAVTKGYDLRLSRLGAAVDESDGLWIAPASPGYDARLVGGEKVVGRDDGDTLRRTFNSAVKSSPDAIGLISWNEFSENTHVEPSKRHGGRSLEVLGDLLDVPAVVSTDFDSSAPTGKGGTPQRALAIGLMAALVAVSTVVLGRRRTAAAPRMP